MLPLDSAGKSFKDICVALVLLGVFMVGCERSTPPDAGKISSSLPAPATNTHSVTPPNLQQTMQEQLAVMQTLQIQKMQYEQQRAVYEQMMAANNKMYWQNRQMACQIAGNCEVRLVPQY